MSSLSIIIASLLCLLYLHWHESLHCDYVSLCCCASACSVVHCIMILLSAFDTLSHLSLCFFLFFWYKFMSGHCSVWRLYVPDSFRVYVWWVHCAAFSDVTNWEVLSVKHFVTFLCCGCFLLIDFVSCFTQHSFRLCRRGDCMRYSVIVTLWVRLLFSLSKDFLLLKSLSELIYCQELVILER